MEVRISKTTLLAIALIVIGITLRLVPHTANFAPIGAIALFAGAILGLRMALWLPLAIMIVSDMVLGLHDTILFTWGGFVLVTLIGWLLRERSNRIRIMVGAPASALLFYLVSNFGVWLESGMYARTWEGLLSCYMMALPFLRTSLMADISFAVLFFGLYAFVAPAFTGQFIWRGAGRKNVSETV
jgi:hypothetical protein